MERRGVWANWARPTAAVVLVMLGDMMGRVTFRAFRESVFNKVALAAYTSLAVDGQGDALAARRKGSTNTP